ncbi:class I SAM-dependent methyltransferase [Massilia sp. DJPM01]|uniref:O-methyltransferase n=1 Tax=Massilia sp. DJPM01 TaxID=3024404 RepID=UPI00259E91C4|nr:class I SAM-dependent methyltransferase [Massilia sp. DJPM01]MDM5177415.1 class I SAM-dependent methyltransferase [Massilia sp. DJPM01]
MPEDLAVEVGETDVGRKSSCPLKLVSQSFPTYRTCFGKSHQTTPAERRRCAWTAKVRCSIYSATSQKLHRECNSAKPLSEIEQFGEENDAAIDERARRMLNITRGTGEFLAHVIGAMGARAILEIGTSNGYSTLWLADAVAANGGKVTTVGMAPLKLRMARENIAASGLGRTIEQVEGDAGALLSRSSDCSYDLAFLDSERTEHLGWWADIKRVLRPHGVLIVDNATSHAAEMAPFMQAVAAEAVFSTSLVTVGKGEFVASRVPDMARYWGPRKTVASGASVVREAQPYEGTVSIAGRKLRRAVGFSRSPTGPAGARVEATAAPYWCFPFLSERRLPAR